MYLYVQKYAHSMNIDNLCVFYKEYFVYGNLPQETIEILHTYLIGPFSENRDGYVPNWMDSKVGGDPIKTVRKKIVKRSTVVSESDLEEGKDNTQFDYDETAENSNKHTNFCKVNPLGFIKEEKKKEGFILGPSVFRKANKSDPEDMKMYEIYTPTIYIRDSIHSDKKSMYKLIVLKFDQMTFVYLLKDQKLEEYEYTVLFERTQTACKNLIKKIEPVIEFYNDNYVRHDSKVKFFYFNETNLAVKYSPSITTDMLTTEMRHFFNVIKEKFASNAYLEEYKITTSRYWLVGVKSLSRLVIIILPVSYEQEKVEEEKVWIINKYFSQFIF
jgi:hypothetical protein